MIPQLPKPRMSSNAVALLGCVMTLSGAAGGTFEADLKKKLSDRRVHCARYVRSVWRYDFLFFPSSIPACQNYDTLLTFCCPTHEYISVALCDSHIISHAQESAKV